MTPLAKQCPRCGKDTLRPYKLKKWQKLYGNHPAVGVEVEVEVGAASLVGAVAVGVGVYCSAGCGLVIQGPNLWDNGNIGRAAFIGPHVISWTSDKCCLRFAPYDTWVELPSSTPLDITEDDLQNLLLLG